jgi:cytochrome d ubiquinol oxidase subunit I
MLPVNAAVSSVSVGAVQTTFFIFVAIFTLFLAIETRIIFKAIKQGPKIDE